MVTDVTPNFIEAMEMAPEGVVLWDADDRLVLCNDRFRQLHSHAAEIIVPGLKLEELLLVWRTKSRIEGSSVCRL